MDNVAGYSQPQLQKVCPDFHRALEYNDMQILLFINP